MITRYHLIRGFRDGDSFFGIAFLVVCKLDVHYYNKNNQTEKYYEKSLD